MFSYLPWTERKTKMVFKSLPGWSPQISCLPPGLSSSGLGPEPELRAATLSPSLCGTSMASGGCVARQPSSLTHRWTRQLQTCSPQIFSSIPPPTPRLLRLTEGSTAFPKGSLMGNHVLSITLRLPSVAKAADGGAEWNCIQHGDKHRPPPSPTAASKEQVPAGGSWWWDKETQARAWAWDGSMIC